MQIRFENRTEAGRMLGKALAPYQDLGDSLVLALPRGGVPVAHEVAKALHAPLYVLIVRKLGVPGHEELAMGAIASGGAVVMNEDVSGFIHTQKQKLQDIIERESQTIRERERLYCDRVARDVKGKCVILVDDGLATGSTMLVAIMALRTQEPERIVVAVPVAPRDTSQSIATEVDDYICLSEPEPFHAVGLWYEDFTQTSDDEVIRILSSTPEPQTHMS